MSTPENKVATVKKDISTQVLAKVEAFRETGELSLPGDYSAPNALKAAYLILSETKNKGGQFALTHCSTESIANALLQMVVLGLSPLKKQCDLIMYGNKLECVVEYTGNIVLAKRYGGLKTIKANAIFEGDKFEFEVDPTTGRKKVLNHKQSLDSIGSKNLKGAYAVYELIDGTIDVEIMNITQIHASWNQGAMKGNSPAHNNFPDQMCIKTVINRACKLLIRGSNDNALFTNQEKQIDVAAEDVKHEIITNSNAEEISFENIEEDKTIEELDIETGELQMQPVNGSAQPTF